MAAAADLQYLPRRQFGTRRTSTYFASEDGGEAKRTRIPKDDERGDRTALLILDMLNGFDVKGGHTLKPAKVIVAMRADLEGYGCPVIDVNDNFWEWRPSGLASSIVRSRASPRSGVSRVSH